MKQPAVLMSNCPPIVAVVFSLFALLLPSQSTAAKGNHLWSQRFGDASSESGWSVAADGSENVIVTGNFYGTVDFGGGLLTSAGDRDIFVAKFDPCGDHLWSQRFGDASDQWGASIAVDSAGNVLAAGYFEGTVDFGGGPLTSAGDIYDKDIFVAKFDPDGNHLWSQRFGDERSQWGNSVAVDGPGNVILTGTFYGTVDFGGVPLVNPSPGDIWDIFVVKFDRDGNHLWSQRFGDSNPNWEGCWSVAVDGSRNVILTGYIEGTVDFGGEPLTSAGFDDIFVVKLDSSGNHVWSKRFGDWNEFQIGESVAVDDSGNVVVTGNFQSTVDFGGGTLTSAGEVDIFVVKFDPGGNHIWSQCFGDASPQWSKSVAIDYSGYVVITGIFLGAVDFGGELLTSGGSHDIYVADFDGGGNHIWSQSFGDASGQRSNGVTMDSSGNIVVTGDFQGTVDFGGGTLTSAGEVDIFVVKFIDPVVAVLPENYTVTYQELGYSYPNPFNPSTRIPYVIHRASHVCLAVYDISGRLINTLVDDYMESGSYVEKWDGRDSRDNTMATGVYFCRLTAGPHTETRRMTLIR